MCCDFTFALSLLPEGGGKLYILVHRNDCWISRSVMFASVNVFYTLIYNTYFLLVPKFTRLTQDGLFDIR